MSDVYAGVHGQPEAVDALRRSGRDPLHAYMLLGPQGSGKEAAAIAFAAQVLCPESDDGCGECRSCRLALAGKHPDLTFARRSRIVLPIGDKVKQPKQYPGSARWIVEEAPKSPHESGRRVIVVPEFDAIRDDAVSALLKTIEEPPATTILVLLASRLMPTFETITSRCALVELATLNDEAVAAALVSEGHDPVRAVEVAALAGGDLTFARTLVDDPGAQERRRMWWAVPDRLDGTGFAATDVLAELRDSLDGVADALLAARHEAEVADQQDRIEQFGEPRGRMAEMVDQHRQERNLVRRHELVRGLGVLASRYRDAAVAVSDTGDPKPYLAAVDEVQRLAEMLERNPNETLQLQRLLLVLPPIAGA